jgi:uncharacterized RDD family membrane protein YckC
VSDHASAEVIGRRIGAALIDLLAVFALMVPVGLVFGQTYAHGGRAGVSLHGAAAIVWAVLVAAYFFVPELLLGRTLGKWPLGLELVSTRGGRPGAVAVAVRTVARVIDFLPFLYLLGFLSLFATGHRAARIGDLLAGTRVVAAPDHSASAPRTGRPAQSPL